MCVLLHGLPVKEYCTRHESVNTLSHCSMTVSMQTIFWNYAFFLAGSFTRGRGEFPLAPTLKPYAKEG